MNTHYIKMLVRKQPLFTVLNFAGLVIGMTATLLLYKYVRYEQTYDLQSQHAGQIWRVFNETAGNATTITQDANTHSAVGPTLKREVSDVVEFARLYCGTTPEVVAVARQQPFDIGRCFLTDPGFLRMFPQQFLAGDMATCLNEPQTAILTKSTAERLFGTSPALGQTFNITTGNMASQYTVTAIVADPPENTHLKFDILAAYATRYASGHHDNFTGYWDYNYFQLAPGASPENARRKLEEINATHLKSEGIRLDIQRFADIHLHSNLTYELEPNGSARIVRFMGLIALLILGIAFMNYINLTTALAGERAKEVGIRKAIGASWASLTIQFLLESLLLTGAAFIVAIFCFWELLTPFGHLVGRTMHFDSSLAFWGPAIGGVTVAALLAGLYPAVQLAGYRPVEVLRGHVTSVQAAGLRKVLVLVQFTCSVVLIIGVLVVGRQLDFLKNHDLGAEIDQILTVKSVVGESAADTLAARKLALFKTACERLSGVTELASSSVLPGLGVNGISGSNRPIHWIQTPDYAHITSYFVDTDEQFISLFGIKILAGKHQFYTDRAARATHVTINRAMLDALGFPSPEAAIGQQIAYQNSENGSIMTVACVIENFHIESLKNKPKPTFYRAHSSEFLDYLSIKITPEHIAAALPAMQTAWAKIFPEQPFRYWFLDQHFAQQYRSETQFGYVFGLFSALAIAISCFGLLGLTAFNVRRRTKEIGIRKVLGASVVGITGLLTKDFLKLVLIAIVIASPVAYYFMDRWLADFAYRIELQWWMFAAAGALAVLIAFLTVGFQSVRAALANPVKSLRSE
jgi:putative ABC transport system permease protein